VMQAAGNDGYGGTPDFSQIYQRTFAPTQGGGATFVTGLLDTL